MEEKKVAEDNVERKKRLEELQLKEGERKRAEYKASIPGQRAILKETREKISSIDHAAQDRRWMAASWTDPRGNRRVAGGPGIVALDPEVCSLPDLLIEDNFRSVDKIQRACSRAMDTIKALLDLLGEMPAAMPPDLEEYMGRILAEIPSLDTIQDDVTHPEPAKDAKPETADGGDTGGGKV